MTTSRKLSLAFALSLSACMGAQSGAPGDDTGDASAVHVRVAHLSPDAPAVDFCVAPHGSTEFAGPVLAGNGGPTGVAYGNVTKYFGLVAAQYDVRLVAPGSADCTKPLGGLADFTDLPDIPEGASVTIAAEGLATLGAGTPFTLRAYVDDTTVDAGQAKLRFIHASPGTPNVDVGVGGGALFTPVFTDVAFGATAGTDGGYVETAPLDGVELSARAHGETSDVLSIKPAVLPEGAIATAFAVGLVGDQTTPLRVLLCDDNAPPTGVLSRCALVGGTPSRAHVRIAHLSPDLRAVDVCIAPTGTTAWSAPVLAAAGLQDGLTYAAVTAYVELPAGSYDVRVIIANATGCSIPAIPDTIGVSVDDGQTATIAAIGDFDTSGAAAGDPPLHLALFNDVTTVPNGQFALRFIHASPGTPAVDVGLGAGGSFTKVFADVSFGHVATNAPINTLGYVETLPVETTVSARLANANTDALTTSNLNLSAGTITSAFAIGGKTGATDHPLQVLFCLDAFPPNGGLTICEPAN